VKLAAEFAVHFVIRLGDAGPDGGKRCARARRPAAPSRNRVSDNAVERAFPAGMRRADRPASTSASKTGAQSAVSRPSARPGMLVTRASAWGFRHLQGVVTVTVLGL